MAYIKKTWSCGDKITADALNHIENGIEAADKGYECVPTSTPIYSGNITTIDHYGDYYAEIDNVTISEIPDYFLVTWNNTEYECVPTLYGSARILAWGDASDTYEEYPFYCTYANGILLVYSVSASTYSFTLVAVNESIETSECFAKAVKLFSLQNLVDGEMDGSVRTVGSNSNLGWDAFAEGSYTTASGIASHAEGDTTTASGSASHAEGYTTTASEFASHAEGAYTIASGSASHAEGRFTTASGIASHAEGDTTTASGSASHAEGNFTIANHKAQHVFGEFNVADTSSATADNRGTYIEIVGKGTSKNARSNARTLDWSGNEVIAGTLSQQSDKRLKEHIDYLGDDAIEFIRGLKPAHYTKDEAHHVGFYAQDVAEVDKWDCMTGEMGDYMTLGYTELIAPLVAYCQYLESRIAELEK